MRTKIVFLTAAGLAALAAHAFTYTATYGALCEKLGGKWASASSSCVTPLCYRTGTCGYWANPARRCELLKVNDHISDVYFQLGEPDEVNGNRFIWRERKGRPVEAVIERERLMSLSCDETAVGPTAGRHRPTHGEALVPCTAK
jgi:hypothetical protein